MYVQCFDLYQTTRNCWIIFIKLFPVIFYLWIIYLFIKSLNFDFACQFFLISLWFNATNATHWNLDWNHQKNQKNKNFERIYCCFFAFYPIRRIYISSTVIQIYSMAFIMQHINTIRNKYHSLPLVFLTQFNIY